MSSAPLRLLILGAHPDDAEFHAGGLATAWCERGDVVKIVSVTDGGAGHHQRDTQELIALRRQEAAAAGRVIGAEYVTWDFPDGALTPSLDVRHEIIREIRTFQPDLVLTHRPNDYHPDHRAVGQAVQDASYMVTVPKVVPEVPALRQDPVVAYMIDLFTRPCPLEPHIALDVTPYIDRILDMLECHASQVYEWLPYADNVVESLPDDPAGRREWLRQWFVDHGGDRPGRFRQALIDTYGPERGAAVEFCEVYEISEYARPLDAARRRELFPGLP